MDITPKKRASIIALKEHAGLSIRQISQEMKVAKSTVGDILKRKQDTGESSTLRQGRCGRKRKTTPRDDTVIIRESIKNPKKTSADLQRDLSTSGVNISSSTVRRRLLEVGRFARKPLKKQLLTSVMKRKRLQWARRYSQWTADDWKKEVFSDESHFEVHGYRSKFVRRSKGEPLRPGIIQQAPKHPPKKMFWGSFSAKGLGRLISVEGMMNSDRYKAILETHLLPSMTRDFPDGDGIFQQDLAPCHTSRKMRTFFEESTVEVLDWPGNSPDINPIENLWAIIKQRLLKEDCSAMAKLISAVIRAWYNDEEVTKMCSTLVESMPNRVQMLVKAQGGHISY